MAVATEQQILDGLAEIIDDIVGIDKSEVTPDKNFVDDLDIDSLSMMTIITHAEDKFDVRIPDEDVKNLSTVGDAVAYIAKAQA